GCGGVLCTYTVIPKVKVTSDNQLIGHSRTVPPQIEAGDGARLKRSFGSNTLLDCVVRPNDTSDSVQIEKVTWKLNGAPVLEFFRGKQKLQTPGFQFASGPFTASNMNVSLLITNTNLSHVGEYQCDVVTDIGDDKKEVHLDVRGKDL
uniref:Ig-like domain-containing protein n=1 Tax=Periophthalmus magnuspinnatus TaxID=409849 RepID=A0A3B4BDV4_9GOBI